MRSASWGVVINLIRFTLVLKWLYGHRDNLGYLVPMSQGPNTVDRHMVKDSQGRRWTFTFYDDSDVSRLKEEIVDALVIVLEKGTKEQHEHFQGYVKFASNRRWSWWKKTFSQSAHWELAKTPEWCCRRYLVDVEAYLKESPQAHFKEQGQVLVDFGILFYTLDKSLVVSNDLFGAVLLGNCLRNSLHCQRHLTVISWHVSRYLYIFLRVDVGDLYVFFRFPGFDLKLKLFKLKLFCFKVKLRLF